MTQDKDYADKSWLHPEADDKTGLVRFLDLVAIGIGASIGAVLGLILMWLASF